MRSKQGQLSRADLLNLIASQGDQAIESEVMDYLADALGMQHQPEKPSRNLTGFVVQDHEQVQVRAWHASKAATPESNQLTNPSPTAKLKAQYWQLLKQTAKTKITTKTKNKSLHAPSGETAPSSARHFQP